LEHTVNRAVRVATVAMGAALVWTACATAAAVVVGWKARDNHRKG
jgi:hypothetical protein